MSDDDMGGLTPTTPVAPVKRAGTKPSSRADPGPSKSKTNGRKRQASLSDSDVQEVERDLVPSSKATTNARRKPSSRVEPPNGDGKPSVKGKGKAKVPQLKSVRQQPDEPVNADVPIEILEDEEGSDTELVHTTNRANGKSVQPSSRRSNKIDEASGLREQLRRAEAHISALTQQIEELFQVRETEAEKLLKVQEQKYETQFKVQQDIIKELHSQLRNQQPLMHSGSSSVLNLLTRDAADEEKQAIEEQVEKWKKLANDRSNVIDELNVKIQNLQDNERLLQVELSSEKDRANNLAAKASKVPSSTLRGGRPGGVDDPKQTEIIRFYEDVTNVIIPSIKPSKAKYFDLDEWVFSCIYTHTDPETVGTKSIHFMLRVCWDQPESVSLVTSTDDLVATINYIPQELDKEPQSFVEKMEFLASPFTFPRDQLSLFLRTMFQTVKEAMMEEVIEID